MEFVSVRKIKRSRRTTTCITGRKLEHFVVKEGAEAVESSRGIDTVLKFRGRYYFSNPLNELMRIDKIKSFRFDTRKMSGETESGLKFSTEDFVEVNVTK